MMFHEGRVKTGMECRQASARRFRSVLVFWFALLDLIRIPSDRKCLGLASYLLSERQYHQDQDHHHHHRCRRQNRQQCVL